MITATIINKYSTYISLNLVITIQQADSPGTTVDICCFLYLHPTIEEEIVKIIMNLKGSVAGWDGIKANVVMALALSIPKPLVHIIKLSCRQGSFPHNLKGALF